MLVISLTCQDTGEQRINHDRFHFETEANPPTSWIIRKGPRARSRSEALWALSDCTAHNGATRLIPGSHLRDPVKQNCGARDSRHERHVKHG